MTVPAPVGVIYAFGDYELDTRLHELRRAGDRLHVEPQVFDVLALLLASRDRLVTKEELLDQVWGHRYVAPTTLNSRIKHARQAVGDDGSAQRVIRTVHGLGFRIVAHVAERAADSGVERAPPDPEHSLLHHRRRRSHRVRDQRHGTPAREAGQLDHASGVRLGEPRVAALDARALA